MEIIAIGYELGAGYLVLAGLVLYLMVLYRAEKD